MQRGGAGRRWRLTVEGRDYEVSGAQVAIISAGRVLIQFRPFPPGWELPGGHCDPGEDPAVTAAREAHEECGLRVRITGLVGVYSWDGLRRVGDAVYRGEITGGSRRPSIEALVTRLVIPAELPSTAFPWVRQRVADAIASAAGAPPVHRVQHISGFHVMAFGVTWLRQLVDGFTRLRHRWRR